MTKNAISTQKFNNNKQRTLKIKSKQKKKKVKSRRHVLQIINRQCGVCLKFSPNGCPAQHVSGQ